MRILVNSIIFCSSFVLLVYGSTGTEVSYPRTVSVHRIDVQGHDFPTQFQFRRKGQPTWPGRTRYRLEGLNHTLVIELQPYHKHTHLKFNLTSPKFLAQSGCYYKGHIVGDILSTVKVSLCEGMTGDIHTSEGDYVIYPIPKSKTRDSSLWPTLSHYLSHLHHPDSRRPWRPLMAQQVPFCDVEEINNTNFQDWDLTEDIYYNSSKILNRKKRSESRELHLEVLVVADSKMANYHGSNLKHYVLTLMSTVSLIYKDPSIGNNINIAVVDVIVLNETTDRQIIHHIAPITLRQFCQWQHNHNTPNDRDPAHYDTAILITREDLCRYPGACDTLANILMKSENSNNLQQVNVIP